MRSLRQKFLDCLGVNTRSGEFGYQPDARFGPLARAKAPERWVKTTCGYCSVGCGMLLGGREGRVVTVRGDPDHPVNRCKRCPKGLSDQYTIHAPGRALHPLLRGRFGFRRIGWEQAIDCLIERARAVQARGGNEAFAVLSTGQLLTEELYALGKLVQLGFRTSSYDGNTTLCMASAVSGYKRSFGSDGPPGSYDDLEQAEVVVIIGANIDDNHSMMAY